MMWCAPNHKNAEEVRIHCHADELMCMKWCAMSHNESYIRIHKASTSKPLHAPCSAMRSTDDTRERCKQKTTYIMSCARDHAHDVMHREPELCFTVDILLHGSIWLQTIGSNPSTSCRTYQIMRINECVVEEKTVQRLSKFFYVIHSSFTSLAAFYCPLLDNP